MTEGIGNNERLRYLAQLALGSLESFTGGFDEIERVDRDIRSILRSMREISDGSLIQSAMREWGQLEILYATLLAEGRRVVDREEQREAFDSVFQLGTIFGRLAGAE
jgi:hypothetical protein